MDHLRGKPNGAGQARPTRGPGWSARLWHGTRQLRFRREFRITFPAWGRRPPRPAKPPVTPAEPSTDPSGGSDPLMATVLAQFATLLWRLRSGPRSAEAGDAEAQLERALRHLDGAWHSLGQSEIEVRDRTGERYVTGLPEKVLAFEPRAGLSSEVIGETVKPCIYCRGILIQRGQVVVYTPDNPPAPEASEPAPDGADTLEGAASSGESPAAPDDHPAEPPPDAPGADDRPPETDNHTTREGSQ